MSTFDLWALPNSVELQFAMVFVFGRLVRPNHGFRQVRIFAPTFHTPGAEVRAFRGHLTTWRGTGSVNRFCKQWDRALATQTVHYPIAETGLIFGHYQCSYANADGRRSRLAVRRGRKSTPPRRSWQGSSEVFVGWLQSTRRRVPRCFLPARCGRETTGLRLVSRRTSRWRGPRW
jgi:hypothetical protein